VRSLSLTCDLAAIRAAEPGLEGSDVLHGHVLIQGQAQEICLLVQPGPEGVTLHALSGAEADKVQVSRWLEDLRRRAEERVAA
jgi:hypothetical protein